MEDLADSQPFSPSDFLDLPPTPPQDLDEGHDPVLPFISRILLEEEMDSNFLDQYHPDHPALVQAQQPFADILCDAAASTTTTKSSSRGSSTRLPPPATADANATCPYEEEGHNNCRVNLDMVHLAFLKGKEEATKFLPATNNSLLVPIVSGSRALQPKQVDEESFLFQQIANGRGCKNKLPDCHDLQVETGRSCKLTASETDHEANEMVDEYVQNWFRTLHKKMMAMTISVDDVGGHEKISRTGKGSDNEAVDLRTLLIHCARAVAAGDRPSATGLLRNIKDRSSPSGDASQRLAHCFAKGLEARLAGNGTQVYKSLMAKCASTVEFLKAYQMYLAVSCFNAMAFKFSNVTICKAIAGKKKVHIVDYGENYGFQWPPLFGYWATHWEGGPPEVRITTINLPQPGFRPAARIDETGRRLSNFARQHGVPFRFHSITAKWDTVSVKDINIKHDEVLIINGLFHLGTLMDEGADIDSLSPRDRVLRNIRKMKPDVFILCIENSSYNAPFFVTRFREALFYYSALFDMMDALAPRDNNERILIEQGLFGRCALNTIACEGLDRVERPETYKQWKVRNDQAGLRQLPLDPDTIKSVIKKVKDNYHKDFVIDVDQQWLLQGWKGRILYAMSAWVANDSTT